MTHVTVDTGTLAEAEATIRQAAAQGAVLFGAPELSTLICSLGEPVLIDAVTGFAARWHESARHILDDTRRLADALALVLSAYAQCEANAATVFGSGSGR